jgi:hypothetical protein
MVRNPPCRHELACVARALKNSQLTSGESHVISRTGH